jgi:hypothetical protein
VCPRRLEQRGRLGALRLWHLPFAFAPLTCGPAVAPPRSPAGELSTEPPPSVARAREEALDRLSGSSDGLSCEQARAQYVEEIGMQSGLPADLTAADFGSVLNAGAYLAPCDVPSTSHVQICVAIQNGRPVGVTVILEPPDGDIEICVARAVRGLSFPSNAKMDIARVRF